jgi:hypothetical protein
MIRVWANLINVHWTHAQFARRIRNIGIRGGTPGRLIEAQGSAVCRVSPIIVKRPVRIIVVWLSIFALFATTKVAEAGPFVDFFRAVRRSIAHPEAKPRSHRSSHKQHNETPPSDASNSQTSGSPVPAPPGQRDVRWAKAASGASQQKTELPYGTPVPGKPGLVTSPFAPDSGYVEVTGFPPGSAVEDPYTGKIFLTP